MFSICLYAQTDSVYYYDHQGNKVWYYVLEDVYSFRLQNGKAYQNSDMDMNVVERNYHKPYNTRQINVMEFKESSPKTGRQTERIRVRELPEFECEYPVLGKLRKLTKEEQPWYTTNDILLVAFADPHISQADVQAFANRNDLIIAHRPENGLDPDLSWTYLFYIQKNKCLVQDPVSKAGQIYEQEHEMLDYVYPNIAAAEIHSCTPVNEMGKFSNQPDALWQLRNQGQTVVIDGIAYAGTADADVNACECWGEGYTGQGVVIGVLDTDVFDYEHVELKDQLLPGWNLSTTPITPMSTTTVIDGKTAHGTRVSSIIAAKANNNEVTAGIAYGAKIKPYLFDISKPGTDQIISGIQQAILDNVAILNMSFGYTSVPLVFNELENAVLSGRKDPLNPSVALGMILVSSTGNDDRSDQATWPASSEYVIGVGASNPYDKRANINDGWPTWNWTSGQPGSNYGPYFDVVAPGSTMWIANLTGGTGPGTTYYALSGGTSLSAPVVSGIAAILLSKNPQLTWQEVHDIVRNGADKVNPSLYDYNYDVANPGRSFEMQFGRVNCLNSLNQTTAAISNKPKELPLNLYQINENEIALYFPANLNERYRFTIMDASGKLIANQLLDGSLNSFTFGVDHLSGGLYLIHFDAGNGQFKTLKYVKP